MQTPIYCSLQIDVNLVNGILSIFGSPLENKSTGNVTWAKEMGKEIQFFKDASGYRPRRKVHLPHFPPLLLLLFNLFLTK